MLALGSSDKYKMNIENKKITNSMVQKSILFSSASIPWSLIDNTNVFGDHAASAFKVAEYAERTENKDCILLARIMV